MGIDNRISKSTLGEQPRGSSGLHKDNSIHRVA